jgi:GrpB-like predicted nucleotidyltransferase (UPF0157 family)
MSRVVPFPDEPANVTVMDYQPQWPDEFNQIADRLSDVLGETAIRIDHVGSTSVPGLAAKDCVDVQVQVTSVDENAIVPLMESIGFRCRPEPWNRSETSSGVTSAKLVFAPAIGSRPCNVHFRQYGGANARFALLFRDYLRADDVARIAWAEFKQSLARSVADLASYGQIKSPATEILMRAAEQWAENTQWVAEDTS